MEDLREIYLKTEITRISHMHDEAVAATIHAETERDALQNQLETLSSKLERERLDHEETKEKLGVLLSRYQAILIEHRTQDSLRYRALQELQDVAGELQKRHGRLRDFIYLLPKPACCDVPGYQSCEGCNGADRCADEPCAKCLGCDE